MLRRKALQKNKNVFCVLCDTPMISDIYQVYHTLRSTSYSEYIRPRATLLCQQGYTIMAGKPSRVPVFGHSSFFPLPAASAVTASPYASRMCLL